MAEAMSQVVSSLGTQFSAANIATVFVGALGVALPLIATWFGIRFVYKKAKGAFKKGN